MYSHTLVFTETDTSKLRKQYTSLLHQLEQGNGLFLPYFDELTLTMQVILNSQTGLKSFWEQVAKFPQQHYHLHLVHDDRELLNLPWQAAIDTREYPFVHISKGSVDIGMMPEYKPHAGPLKILVMISSPENLEHHQRLSYEEEEQGILDALGPLWETGQVQVDFTEDGSLYNLREKLQLQYYHILYISGHGIYKNNTGYLLLENEETLKSELIEAKRVAQALQETQKHLPALVILASCQTAQGKAEEGFRGVADELMHAGVPAVVAMAFSITDRYANVFAAHLYENLAKKESLLPSYSKALVSMQQREQQQLTGIHSQYRATQWLIPQLYFHQQIDQIIDWQAPAKELQFAQNSIAGTNRFFSSLNNQHFRFIGRRRESAQLFSKLLQGEAILLRGQGGIGKTSLAVHLMKRLVTHDPSFYFFVFDETNISLENIKIQLLQYLKNEQQQTEIDDEISNCEDIFEQLDYLLLQVTQYCKPVWVFDNLESCQEEPGGPMHPKYDDWLNIMLDLILDEFPVILTSRYPIHELPDVFDCSLNQVPFVDFYRKCMQLNLVKLKQEYVQVDFSKLAWLLFTVLGGSYRLLEIFDEICKNDPERAGAFVQEVKSFRELPGGDDQKKITSEIAAKALEKLMAGTRKLLFAELLNVLSAEELIVFRLLCLFDTPVLKSALEMQRPGYPFNAKLKRLKDLTLIEEQVKRGGGTESKNSYTFYYVTPLVKDWLNHSGFEPPTVEFILNYAAKYYKYAWQNVTWSYGDMEQAFNLYAIVRDIHEVNECGAIITNEYYKCGYYDLTLFYGNHVEEITGKNANNDVLNNMALTYLHHGELDKAKSYFEKCLAVSRKKGDKKMQATALNGISQVYYSTGDLDNTLKWLKKSILAARESGHKETEAVTLTNIGNIYADRDEHDKAFDYYQQSLDLRKITGNHIGEVIVLQNIGGIYIGLGDYEKALEIFNEGLIIAIKAGYRKSEAKMLHDIGVSYYLQYNYQKALGYLQKSFSIWESVKDIKHAGESLCQVGMTHKMLKNYNEAIECLTNALVMIKKFNDPDMESNVINELGHSYFLSQRFEEALPYMEQSLVLFRKAGDEESESMVLDHISLAYTALGMHEEAIQAAKKNVNLRKSLDDSAAESFTKRLMSMAQQMSGDNEGALKMYKKALAEQRKHGNRAEEAMILFSIAEIMRENGNTKEYIEYERQAYCLFDEDNNLQGLYHSGWRLGFQLCSISSRETVAKGLEFLQQSYEIGIQENYDGVEQIGILLKAAEIARNGGKIEDVFPKKKKKAKKRK